MKTWLRAVTRLPLPAVLVAAVVIQAGCYPLVHRPRDEANVRRQLHVPRGVRLAFLDSHPKEAGFFGREGLRITAVFQLDAAQLEAYLERTGRPDVWRPVALLDYSPDRAQVYSEDCFRWHDLPLPDWTGRYLRHVAPVGELLGRDGVRWFGYVIYAERGARVEHEGGGTHDVYTYRAASVAAAPDTTSNVVAVFGFLDPSTRRLCGHIAFSG